MSVWLGCILCKFERLYKLEVLSISRPRTTAADMEAESYATTQFLCADILSIVVLE